ncbi:MAG: hypothetical protein ACOX7B_05765 [Christensenellales bacterium]|jgi:hypothetical protein
MERFEMLPIEVYAQGDLERNVADDFYIARCTKSIGNGLSSERVRVCNNTNREYRVSIVYRVVTRFIPNHWLIPCVMYDGNPFGSRSSPKGLTYAGRPWIFSGDRCGIPACTLSEDENNVFALFSSDETPISLNCACSMERIETGNFMHTLVYPRMEAPLSYTGKNTMREGFREYMTIPSGGSVEFCCYLYSGVPRWKNFGYASLLPCALKVLRHDHLPAMAAEEVKQVCLAYLRASRNTVTGTLCYSVECRDYTHPIGNLQTGGEWDGLTLAMLEENPELNSLMYKPCGMGMGFSSQGIMILRMLLKDALERKDTRQQNEVISILERWISMQRPNGLVSLQYPRESQEADPSSLGWGMGEMAKIYTLLSENGIDRLDFLNFSRKIADFLRSILMLMIRSEGCGHWKGKNWYRAVATALLS